MKRIALSTTFFLAAVLLAIPANGQCLEAISADVGEVTTGTIVANDIGSSAWPREQEIAIPTKPVVATITAYRITGFSFSREPEWRFTITFVDSNGRVYADDHEGLTNVIVNGQPGTNPNGADTLIKQMNSANFTSTSLIRRLYQHLEQHGKIPASTVTGEVEK